MKRALQLALLAVTTALALLPLGCPGNYIEGSGRDLDDAGVIFFFDAGRRDSGRPDGN